jgi:CubicO group peptidase (beta-lactamase class C family)
MAELELHGHCDDRFTRVREAFDANFAERGEVGGSVALLIDGEAVVDLWAGWADEARTRRWERDTIALTHSVTKGFVATCLHLLHLRGQLDWDKLVTDYWPEFASAVEDASARELKARTTVRQLVSHQAGLPVIDEELPPGAGLDWELMIHAIERQPPIWEPGTKHGYHAGTWGYMTGELIRRIDGRTPGTFLREEICEPWDLDFHLGFGPELDERVADMLPPPPPTEDAPSPVETPLRARAFGLSQPKPDQTPREARAAEQPSGNGHGNARALARLYGGLAAGGELDGVRLFPPEAIPAMWETQADGIGEVIGTRRRFGLGYWLHDPDLQPSRSMESFGHIGVGGQRGFADPPHRLGFGYAANRLGAHVRAQALEEAVYGCL